MDEQTQFLNVDLELTGDGLEELLKAWGDDVFVLHRDQRAGEPGIANLEIAGLGGDTAERTILMLLELIEGLPPELRARWDALSRRDFDIGIQAEVRPTYWQCELSNETLARVAALGGLVRVTVYAPFEDEDEEDDGEDDGDGDGDDDDDNEVDA